MTINGVLININGYYIIILQNQGKATFGRFGSDVSYYKAMSATAESAICNQGYIFAQACTDDGGGGLSISGIPRGSFWTHVSDDYYISFIYFSGSDAFNHLFLTIKDPGRACEKIALFPGNLATLPRGARLPYKIWMWPVDFINWSTVITSWLWKLGNGIAARFSAMVYR